MKTTKEQRDELDAKVLALFRPRYTTTLHNLMHKIPVEYGERDVDRSLQRLRKSGKIQFQHGAWRLT